MSERNAGCNSEDVEPQPNSLQRIIYADDRYVIRHLTYDLRAGHPEKGSQRLRVLPDKSVVQRLSEIVDTLSRSG